MKKIMIILMGIVLLISAVACGGGAVAQWQEQYDLGMKYLLDGEYEEAVLAFTAAIEIEPKLPEAYIGRGDAYIQWGEVENDAAEEMSELAVADYLQAIDLDENNAEVYLKAADVYVKLGDIEAARELLEKGYRITGNKSLQEKLEELSGEVNLTGREVFSLTDLEEWGYPYGMTIDSLKAKGEIDTPRIEQWLRNAKHIKGLLGINGEISEGLVSFWGSNHLIGQVSIFDGSMKYGPRGICLGMSMEDILKYFCCTDPNIIKYAKTQDETLFMASEEEPWLYRIYDEEGGKNYSGWLDYSLDGDKDALYYYVNRTNGGELDVRMYILFENNSATHIDITYFYDDLDFPHYG